MTRTRLKLVELEEGSDAWNRWRRYVGDLHGFPTAESGHVLRLLTRRRPRVSWWLIGADRTVLAVGPVLYDTAEAAAEELRRLRDLTIEGLIEAYPYRDDQGGHSFTLVESTDADGPDGLAAEDMVVAIAARRYAESYERNLAVFKTLRAVAVEDLPVRVSAAPTFPDPAGAPEQDDTWPPLVGLHRLPSPAGLARVYPIWGRR